MKKQNSRNEFFDLIADEFAQTLTNILQLTSDETVPREQVGFQLGRLNETNRILSEVEYRSKGHLTVEVSINIKEKKVSK